MRKSRYSQKNIQVLTAMMIDKNNISKSSPAQKDTSTPADPTTVVPTKRRDPPFTENQKETTPKYWWHVDPQI